MMKIAIGLLCFGAITLAGSALAQPTDLTISTKSLKDIADDGLYRVALKCNLPTFSNQVAPPSVFGDKVRQIAFAITLSTSPVAANQAPPTASVIAAIPVSGATISKSNPVKFTNKSCDQTFLVTGRTALYLTGLFTEVETFQPSELVNVLTALAGTIAPLAVLFPAGPQAILKTDASIPGQTASSYAGLWSAFNKSQSQTYASADLKEGYYLIQTPHGDGGSVSISIDRLASMQSALSNRLIRIAYEATFVPFGNAITSGVSSNPTVCNTMGKILELNQNYAHADAVDALAHAVVLSGINSAQASTCLSKVYAHEVAQNKWLIANSTLRITDGVDANNIVAYPPTVFGAISAAMNNYAAGQTGQTSNAILDKYFTPLVSVNDTTTQIFTAPANLSIEQVIDKLKGAKQNFIYFGCQEKDATGATDNNGVPDTGYILAIGKSKNPQDTLLLRTWMQYTDPKSTVPQIYELTIGSDSAIQTALKDYNNQCAFQITVNTPPAH
jgi:hypothetical protein